MKRHRHAFIAAFCALLAGCAASPAPRPDHETAFDPIGLISVPSDAAFDGIRFGGISGIDREPRSDDYVLVSDDRSEHGPARFHMVRLDFDAAEQDRFRIVATVPILTRDGAPYPPPGHGEPADAEALRLDPLDGSLWWASEGDRAGPHAPAIRRMDRGGRWLGEWPLPPRLAFDPQQRRGPRPNLAFEGMDWDAAGENLWLALEAPLWQDGALAGTRHGALLRLSLLGRDGRLHRQLAYRTEPVPPPPPQRLADNGVSELLTLDADHLLLLERAGVQREDGGFDFHARLYCVALDGAQDISALSSLADAEVRAVSKRLLLDLSAPPGLPAANYEAMAWAPDAPGGQARLLLASDNNFDPRDATHFVLLQSRGRLDDGWKRRHCPGPAR